MDPILKAATLDCEFWLKRCAQIRKKDGSIEPAGAIKPNKLQLEVLKHYRECQIAKKPCLIMILKPRQKGASTIAEAVIYHHMRTHPGLNGALMGDIAATSDKVFEMFRRYYESDTYPWNQGPIDEDKNLADEITLPNGSKWYKETAGSTNAGRSGTVQVAHMEEVAFFQTTVSKDPTTAFLGSFYKDGPMSLGFATSTANGASGWFYDTWNTKDNAWKKIFAAWFEFEDSSRPFENAEARATFERSLNEDEINEQKLYNVTLEQLNWRRHIINTDYRGDVAKFRQEMPSNEEECLTAETRVGTSKGMVRICDIEEGAWSDHGIVVAKKSKGVRPVFKLTTKMGYSLRGTEEHRIALAEGGFCGLARTAGKKIKLQAPVLADNYHVAEWTGFGGVRHALRIDERWGQFLGYFMGDGCFDNDSMELVCAAKDADAIAAVKANAEDVWGVPFRSEPAGTKGGAVRLRCSNKQFSGILDQLGCVEKATDKRPVNGERHGYRKFICVPECIWRSPRPVVAAFLRGLFEADGWSNPRYAGVKFFTYRPAFMRDVQRLLLAFGIHSTIRGVVKTNGEGKKFPGEELALPALDAIRFHREIGFISQRKDAAAASTRKADGRAKDAGMVDEVVSVVPDGEEEVWDIQIDGEPVFSANGILVHNCFLLTSRPRFDPVAVKNMQALAATNDYRQRGNLVIQGDKSALWLPDAQGSIHRMEEPIIGCRYLVSADTCTGEDQQISGHTADPDWHSVQVWRQGFFDQGAGVQRNPMLVAYHKSQVDTDELAEIIASLSFYYGKCLAIPEVNGMGGLHVVKLLVAYGVPVFRRKPHTNHSKRKTEEEEMEAFGWLTDTLTRKWIIDALVPLVRTERLDIFYREILDQFRTFVITEHGKAEAMPGKHDDDVLAAAIALFNMGAATEYRLRQARGVDLMRLARDPRYMAPSGFVRVAAQRIR